MGSEADVPSGKAGADDDPASALPPPPEPAGPRLDIPSATAVPGAAGPGAAAGPPPRRRRRVLLLGGIGALVLALIAGVTTWLVVPGSSSRPPAANRMPFDAAVTALAGLAAVHYVSSGPGGAPGWDVRVTGHGEAVGTVTLDDEPIDLLVVDGKTFVRSPDGIAAGRLTEQPAVNLENKWVTGRGVTADSQLDAVLHQLLPPLSLAHKLRAELDDVTSLPPPNATGTALGGVPALKAGLSSGTLYVSKDAPYRVLGLVPAEHWNSFLDDAPARPGACRPPTTAEPPHPRHRRTAARTRTASASSRCPATTWRACTTTSKPTPTS